MITRDALLELERRRAVALAAHDRWLELHKDTSAPIECVSRAAKAATWADNSFATLLQAEAEGLMLAAWDAIDPPPSFRTAPLLLAAFLGAAIWLLALVAWRGAA